MKRNGKMALWTMVIAAACFLAGCGKLQLPESPIVYERGSNGEYIFLTQGDKMYVPYCAWSGQKIGDCIGYCDIAATEYSGAVREYICGLQGYSSDQWIVAMLNVNCTEGMIMREWNTTEIPSGFSSEYEWNQ